MRDRSRDLTRATGAPRWPRGQPPELDDLPLTGAASHRGLLRFAAEV